MIKPETLKEYSYTGRLAPIIARYVNEKRGLGLKFETGAKVLKNFDRFTRTMDFKDEILPKELVLAYTAKRPDEKDSNRYHRIAVIKGFAEYMRRCGYDAYVPPPQRRRSRCSSFAPYIFSDDEIKRLFKAADSIEPNHHNKQVCLAAPLFFRMLYSCGLRESEAAFLTVSDVDLASGVIRIAETKFNKSRYVPMSESLWRMCVAYAEGVHLSSSAAEPFFRNRRNEFFSPSAVYDMFRKLLWNAGISHGGKGKGPRIHDLRHTFAVHCLKKWSQSGMDLTVALPYLSAYLGHTGLYASQKYLRLTADVFPHVAELLNERFGDLIPEKGGEIYGG